jgi:chromosome partitioning protein
MLRVLIANSKGGCGKTLVATNLAAAYAHAGHPTVLLDCDPQGSSQRWMAQRGRPLPALQVQPMAMADHRVALLWSLRVPARTQVLVVDAPAGLDGSQMAELARRCDHLLIPVVPSPLDLAASADFIERLGRLADVRSGRLQVGVIGNRIRAGTIASRELLAALQGWRQPLVAQIREAQAFIHAASIGRGVAEFDLPRAQELAAPFQAIRDWLPPAQPLPALAAG